MTDSGRIFVNMQQLSLYAVAAFGLEGLVAAELKRLGMKNIMAENGGARFTGSLEDAYLCNLRLRFSDRIYCVMAEDVCLSFEDLFQLVRNVPWEAWTNGTEAFQLSAQCARSRLMSPRDCQSIGKKAVLERLKEKTGRSLFPETGADFPIHLSLHADCARVMLNLSGVSLSRRGYRTWNGEAPLRETLAAALVELSPWKPGIPLYDPCCGTGTLLIEAALRQGHIAPGLNRTFAMDHFQPFPAAVKKRILEKTRSECIPERISQIAGSDIDAEPLELAGRHEKQAGLNHRIIWTQMPLQEVVRPEPAGVFLCNPPYGERLMKDKKACQELVRDLGRLQARHPGWSLCAISSDPGFEKAYGRHADKKRRLYNGRLECQFFTFLPR